MNNDKTIPAGFAGWSYSGVEWTDFTGKIPPLPERGVRLVKYASDNIPKKGDMRIVRIYTSFEEDEFYLNYVPSSVYFYGFTASDLERSAVVRCKLIEVISSNDANSWIKVQVEEVIMLSSLVDKFPECKCSPLPEEAGWQYFEEVKDTTWECIGRTMQDDVTEKEIYYKGHLVLRSYEDFDLSISYFGNAVCR